MPTPTSEIVPFPVWSDSPPAAGGVVGLYAPHADIGRLPDFGAVDDLAEGRGKPASVRWSLLLGDLVRLARTLPAPTHPKRRRRRIGEPPLPPAPQAPATNQLAWIQLTRAHVLGVLSRHCHVEAAVAGDAPAGDAPAGDGAPDDGLEARLMILLADHLLGQHVDWPGRPLWQGNGLADYLFTDPRPMAHACGHALLARLGAGNRRFTAILPMLRGLGLTERLLPIAEAGDLIALIPPPPLLRPLPVPPAPAVRFLQKPGILPWIAAGLLALAGVLIWQHLLWQGVLADVAAQLASLE
ncbi:MAG TPA: hypothetical protein VK196_16360 [Magnetospirillum sp.]|nr:hypothetical protein [Magnetospirillum sp.]